MSKRRVAIAARDRLRLQPAKPSKNRKELGTDEQPHSETRGIVEGVGGGWGGAQRNASVVSSTLSHITHELPVQVYESLIGIFEQNNLAIDGPSPLESYWDCVNDVSAVKGGVLGSIKPL